MVQKQCKPYHSRKGNNIYQPTSIYNCGEDVWLVYFVPAGILLCVPSLEYLQDGDGQATGTPETGTLGYMFH